jgi:hypothetical protein
MVRKLVAGICGALLVLASGYAGAPAEATAAQGPTFALSNEFSGKCLEVHSFGLIGSEFPNGTKVELRKCSGRSHTQLWMLKRVGSDGKHFVDYNIVVGFGPRRHCLDADVNTARLNPGVVQIYACNKSRQQIWRYFLATRSMTSVFTLMARPPIHPKCLDADINSVRYTATVVQLWDCNNSRQQSWIFKDLTSA